MKIKALPFMAGSIGYSLFSGGWEFTISAAIIFTILLVTKQADWI